MGLQDRDYMKERHSRPIQFNQPIKEIPAKSKLFFNIFMNVLILFIFFLLMIAAFNLLRDPNDIRTYDQKLADIKQNISTIRY